jgi:hypothetical protein
MSRRSCQFATVARVARARLATQKPLSIKIVKPPFGAKAARPEAEARYDSSLALWAFYPQVRGLLSISTEKVLKCCFISSMLRFPSPAMRLIIVTCHSCSLRPNGNHHRGQVVVAAAAAQQQPRLSNVPGTRICVSKPQLPPMSRGRRRHALMLSEKLFIRSNDEVYLKQSWKANSLSPRTLLPTQKSHPSSLPALPSLAEPPLVVLLLGALTVASTRPSPRSNCSSRVASQQTNKSL